MFDLAGAASNAGMDADEAGALLGAYFGAVPDRGDAARLRGDAMRLAAARGDVGDGVGDLHWPRPVPIMAPMRGTTSAGFDADARRLPDNLRKDHDMTLPTHAQIVVIGGGIIGCSTAYHLARDHKADVVLLEQGKLTSGSTWHAAGLVGQLRSSASITRVLKYSVELYKGLEAETGLETGWKMTGCLRLATNAGPLDRIPAAGDHGAQLRHGHASDLAAEVKRDVAADGGRRSGRRQLAADRRAGRAPPTSPRALAKGARMHGAKILEGVRVTGFDMDGGRITAVRTDQGEIACETGGELRRAVGAAGRRHGRHQRAAAAGQAPVYRHREDRRAGAGCADACATPTGAPISRKRSAAW